MTSNGNASDLAVRAAVGHESAFVIETSKGPITLARNEHDLLNRLLAGTASMAEGQSFYQILARREVPLPMEWELLVLRATLAVLPDRDDLVSRLALVEQTVAPTTEADDLTSRLAFEKTWVRFAHSDLVSAFDQHSRDTVRKSALDNACMLLASPVFDRQSISRKVELIVALHNTLMSVPSADLPVVADLGLRRFRDMLRYPELSEAQACSVFDALHSLYFSGISDVRDLRRFDAIVPMFEAWLEQRLGQRSPLVMAPAGQRPMTIAYLLHTAHFDRGNAVSPLVCSIAEMHAAVPNRRILLYAVQHVAPDFVAEMARRNVTVRAFQQGHDYNRIDEVAEALKSDGVEIVVTEQNRAIAAALFVRRVAPRQMWFDTGFPYWDLKALDWTMSPSFDAAASTATKTSLITLRQTADTLKKPVDAAAVARLRESFPDAAFVLGVFVRLIKLNRTFLDFLGRLLAADSRFHLVIAGPGDPGSVESFLRQPNMAGRATFVAGAVDLNLYGPAIDVMCDTFPFVGGNACREVASHGTPVLSKLGTPWDTVLRADRNPDLLARTEGEYIALATRLASDTDFRHKQRQVALTKAAEYSDPTRMIDEIEAAIAQSIAYY
jgi:hypothetical protein